MIKHKVLEQLDEINWSSLHTAHGTAENVPIALKALASAQNDSQLFDAYWKLDNYIVLQGTLYESAYFAVPYILHILFSSHWSQLRLAAYDLLIEIARGVPDPGCVWAPPQDTPEDLREACRGVIASDLTVYEPDLYSDDTAVRCRALELLTSFDDNPDGHLRTLLDGIDPGEDVEFARLLEQAKNDMRDN